MTGFRWKIKFFDSFSNSLERGAAEDVRNCCSQLQVDHHNCEEGTGKEGQGYTGAHCQAAVLRTVSLHWKTYWCYKIRCTVVVGLKSIVLAN